MLRDVQDAGYACEKPYCGSRAKWEMLPPEAPTDSNNVSWNFTCASHVPNHRRSDAIMTPLLWPTCAWAEGCTSKAEVIINGRNYCGKHAMRDSVQKPAQSIKHATINVLTGNQAMQRILAALQLEQDSSITKMTLDLDPDKLATLTITRLVDGPAMQSLVEILSRYNLVERSAEIISTKPYEVQGDATDGSKVKLGTELESDIADGAAPLYAAGLPAAPAEAGCPCNLCRPQHEVAHVSSLDPIKNLEVERLYRSAQRARQSHNE